MAATVLVGISGTGPHRQEIRADPEISKTAEPVIVTEQYRMLPTDLFTRLVPEVDVDNPPYYLPTVTANAGERIEVPFAEMAAMVAAGVARELEAPTVPANLAANATSDTEIDLTWDASTDNLGVTGYRVYRDDALIDTALTNAYSDSGLTPSTEYTYEVSAIDASGNESDRSDPAADTTDA